MARVECVTVHVLVSQERGGGGDEDDDDEPLAEYLDGRLMVIAADPGAILAG
jgi:hypothetical protein